MKSKKAKGKIVGFIFLLFNFYFLTSCSSQPTDLRTLIPADSLVYLESNDLGAVMKVITDRPAFREAAKTIPDFSFLNGVKLAVAVTGFETKELQVTDEASVLNFQPRFVAVLETNAWNFQALSFAENQLGEFINNVYGGEVLLESSDKHDGKYFVWKASDGRKAYALVQGSLVFFGNDETALEKSLAVKRGEAESIAKNPKVTNGDRLAFGYVSPDGVSQLANVLGVKYASEASDEPEVQGAVAGILPQIIRNLVKDIVWTASRNEEGFDDTFLVTANNELASVLTETFAPNPSPDFAVLDTLNTSVSSVTFYNLKNPHIAWRSLVLAALKDSDPVTARIGALYAEALFDTYGIKDPEAFLSSVKGTLVTARVGENGDGNVVVASTTDERRFRNSLTSALMPATIGFENGRVNYLKGQNEEIAAMQEGSIFILGTPDSLLKAIPAGEPENRSAQFQKLLQGGRPSVVTVGTDRDTSNTLASNLGVSNLQNQNSSAKVVTQTRFEMNGIERKTLSDFGFIGWIMTQFERE